jgi:hypothetical protein
MWTYVTEGRNKPSKPRKMLEICDVDMI